MKKWIWKKYQELSRDELYAIMQIRQEVFVIEQEILYIDCDDKDQLAWHCWSSDESEKILAYARVIQPGVKFKESSIGRVLTTKAARGKGLAREMMLFIFERLSEEVSEPAIRMSAQQYLEQFYMGLGFKTVSNVYLEEGIEHVEMLRA